MLLDEIGQITTCALHAVGWKRLHIAIAHRGNVFHLVKNCPGNAATDCRSLVWPEALLGT